MGRKQKARLRQPQVRDSNVRLYVDGGWMMVGLDRIEYVEPNEEEGTDEKFLFHRYGISRGHEKSMMRTRTQQFPPTRCIGLSEADKKYIRESQGVKVKLDRSNFFED